jgi:hypothetical protein
MSKPKDKVRIRIAVAVGSAGGWNSCGWGSSRGNEKDTELVSIAMEPMEDAVIRQYWVECDVPIPFAEAIVLDDVTVTPAKEPLK